MNKSLKNSLFVALGLLLYTQVEAQSTRQFIALRAGFSQVQTKDYFHSDYTYQGTGLNLQATYGQERVNTHWQLNVGYAHLRPQSIVSRKASTRIINADFNYYWRLSPATERRFRYYSGVGLQLASNTTNYSPDIDVTTVQATAMASLGALAKATYQFKADHDFSLQAFANVISAVYRPTYAFYGKDQLTATWVGQSPVVATQVRYNYHVNKHFQATCQYQISYFKYAQPRPVSWLQQQISVGIQRSF